MNIFEPKYKKRNATFDPLKMRPPAEGVVKHVGARRFSNGEALCVFHAVPQHAPIVREFVHLARISARPKIVCFSKSREIFVKSQKSWARDVSRMARRFACSMRCHNTRQSFANWFMSREFRHVQKLADVGRFAKSREIFVKSQNRWVRDVSRMARRFACSMRCDNTRQPFANSIIS